MHYADSRSLNLDHVRALAALTVFVFHFAVRVIDEHEPYEPTLIFFGQGFTGVSIFMVLSGYLFAKLTEGYRIDYAPFIVRRTARLGPLLLFVLAVSPFAYGVDVREVFRIFVTGFVLPTWPNGGWSVAVELHFYLLLPFLLAVAGTRLRTACLIVIAVMILIRTALFLGDVPLGELAYLSLVGRADQFLMGIIVQRSAGLMRGRHEAAVLAVIFLLFGLEVQLMTDRFKVMKPVTIVWYLYEGVIYALLIAWYDRSFSFADRGLARAVAALGRWSYSFYLLHLFFVGWFITTIEERFGRILSADAAMLWSVATLPFFFLISALGYLVFEKPFLRVGRSYLIPDSGAVSSRQGRLERTGAV